jgi:hypothetical protein
MTGKKKGYLSLSEAADLLKTAFGTKAKTEQSKGEAIASPKPGKSGEDQFAEMERAMLAKGAAQIKQASARREVPNSNRKKKKNKGKQPNSETPATPIPEACELSLSKVRSAHQKSSNQLPYGWEIIAELSAAIAGYAADPTSQAAMSTFLIVRGQMMPSHLWAASAKRSAEVSNVPPAKGYTS